MHSRFKTGAGGLGHLIQRQTVGFEKTYAFYKLLGMRGGVEYRIPVPGLNRPADLVFLHCNDRDHTLAFWNVALQTAFGLAAVWGGYRLGLTLG